MEGAAQARRVTFSQRRFPLCGSRSYRRSGKNVLWAVTLAVLVAGGAARAEYLPPIARQLTETRDSYTVQRGDTLRSLSSRHGIAIEVLARENGLKPNSRLKVGQALRIDNRHIVPANLSDGILINVPQLMLFHLEDGHLLAAYPVALGKPTWRTPPGPFNVLEMREHPVWRVPESIQREMAMEGRVVKTVVAPGPDNPLGDWFIALSLANVGVHSTNAPLTIYGFRTHGCIRLHPEDARELFEDVEVGDRGEIIYQTVLMARLDDGRIFVEAHRDVYGLDGDTAFVRALAESNGLTDRIDWDKAEKVIQAAEGIARDITRGAP